MAKQVTLQPFKEQLERIAAQQVENRLEDIAQYAVNISPVDTGAYVESFSIGRAGSGGGRSRTSHGKPKNQNPEAKKQQALGQLNADIAALPIEQMLEDGNARFTLRNRAPHANTVEDGSSWKRTDGYYVFTKIRRKFG
jgi:hypothetical protein